MMSKITAILKTVMKYSPVLIAAYAAYKQLSKPKTPPATPPAA